MTASIPTPAVQVPWSRSPDLPPWQPFLPFPFYPPPPFPTVLAPAQKSSHGPESSWGSCPNATPFHSDTVTSLPKNSVAASTLRDNVSVLGLLQKTLHSGISLVSRAGNTSAFRQQSQGGPRVAECHSWQHSSAPAGFHPSPGPRHADSASPRGSLRPVVRAKACGALGSWDPVLASALQPMPLAEAVRSHLAAMERPC